MLQVSGAQQIVLHDVLKEGVLPGRSAREGLIAELQSGDVKEVANLLTRLSAAIDRDIKPPVQDQVYVDKRSGIAFIEPFVPATVHILQDCFDPEAKLRQSVHWQNLDPLNGSVHLHEIPEFRPAAIGGAIAHTLGELALNGYRAKLEGHDREVAFTDTPTIFIANTAPRSGGPREQGAPFIYARLGYNIFYFGTNSEELTYLKDFLIGNPHEIKIAECTTYRSRFLGKRVGEWRHGDISKFGGEIDSKKISAAPRGAIVYVDNFGNVKLNFTGRELRELGVKPGEFVTLKANGFSTKAQFVEKLEDGHNGNLLIAIGSSRANFGQGTDSNSVDLYLKNNPKGASAASRLCDAFQVETRPTPRHLLPLPGIVLELEKAEPPLS